MLCLIIMVCLAGLFLLLLMEIIAWTFVQCKKAKVPKESEMEIESKRDEIIRRVQKMGLDTEGTAITAAVVSVVASATIDECLKEMTPIFDQQAAHVMAHTKHFLGEMKATDLRIRETIEGALKRKGE